MPSLEAYARPLTRRILPLSHFDPEVVGGALSGGWRVTGGLLSWSVPNARPSVASMNETRIITLRRERGWTQEKLAAESGVAVRTVQRLESGQDASLETLSMVAKALGVTVGELFSAVESDDFQAAVGALDDRSATQQRQRDGAVAGYRYLYTGVGLVVSVGVIVLIGLQIVPGIAILLTGLYWAGGALLGRFLLASVINPRLDAKYPLSIPTPSRRDR